MAVEKAIVFDDLQKGDDEAREDFRRGGRSRRGGAKGGRRGGGGGVGGRSRKGGAAPSGAQGRSRKGGAAPSGAQGRSRKGGAAPSGAQGKSKKGGTAPSGAQGRTRRGTTTTAKDVQKAADKINRDFNERTGFKTKDGFLRDIKGNIVRSKTQVNRFKEDKRRQDIARRLGIDTTLGAAAANPNLRSQQMTPGAFRLSNRLSDFKKSLGTGLQTPENLGRLVDINRQLGDFDYSGMGIANQLKTQAGDLAAGIPGLAKIGGALAGGPMGLASLVATGGKGLLGLLGDKLGFGKDEQQVAANPNLREGTMTTQQPGFLSGIASALRLGEGPGFQEERGGGGGQPMIPPPVMAPAPTVQQVAQQTPITAQPVDSRMLNQYLAMAGFSPEEISGLSEDTRYLG
jgi:hypothetical protein